MADHANAAWCIISLINWSLHRYIARYMARAIQQPASQRISNTEHSVAFAQHRSLSNQHNTPTSEAASKLVTLEIHHRPFFYLPALLLPSQKFTTQQVSDECDVMY